MRNSWAILLGVAWLWTGAHAGEWTPPTDAEWDRLPGFCAVKKRELNKTDPNAIQIGMSMIGQQFQNAHHFCFGLNFLNRYYASPFGPKAGSNLAMAINELTYMAEHLVPGSTLASDIFLYRATAYALAKRNVEAGADFRRAIEYNPRNEKAYLAYADFLIAAKQKPEALRLVSEGLKYVPGSRGLQRRYTDWGGTLPFPEPVVAEAPPAGASEGDGQVRAMQSPDRPKAAAPRDDGMAARDAAAAQPASEPAVPSGASPCRFCPDQP